MTLLFRIYRGTLQYICPVESLTAFSQGSSNYKILDQWYSIGPTHSYSKGAEGSAFFEMFKDEKSALREIFTKMERWYNFLNNCKIYLTLIA